MTGWNTRHTLEVSIGENKQGVSCWDCRCALLCELFKGFLLSVRVKSFLVTCLRRELHWQWELLERRVPCPLLFESQEGGLLGSTQKPQILDAQNPLEMGAEDHQPFSLLV